MPTQEAIPQGDPRNAISAPLHDFVTLEQFHQEWPGVSERALEGVTCEWFALCSNPIVGFLSHPILGWVPVCERCRAKVGALSQ